MISVCMATYNGEVYIKQQVNSILDQLDQDDELIISDDGSTDKTIQIIKEINDNRIKIYYCNSKCYTRNFENALMHAKGEYIFLSDQDDIWLSNKIDRMVSELKSNKYDFIISDAAIVDDSGNITCNSRNKMLNIRKGFLRNFIKTNYLGCCMAFNRKVLDEALPFPKNYDLCYHDAWIALLSEFKFKTYVLDEVLMYYRRHNQNVSTGGLKYEWKIIKSIKIRGYLLLNIINRKNRLG